ncbi:MAG: aminoacyl-tRNA hydrolase [Desulfobacteraceae bacterium]|nr:aminoacyl-tRNA hydrolase [Desulfobacteraceae bacterium]MBC2749111.1 aminoacyl-tRNA hydrolase [Desulfobacteraceae bacterium]
MIHINADIVIPDSEITLAFVRADGPGGQHVNKTATAVQLRFDVRQSPSLPEGVRQRLQRLAGQRLTRDGVLVIDARSHRSQKQNREEALGRLIRLVQTAARPPRPRRPTKPSAASRRRRLENKRQRARLKQSRRSVRDSD